jgi:hypothetical protein
MPPNLFGESDKTVIQNDEVGLFGLFGVTELLRNRSDLISEVYRKAFAKIAKQTPSAIASTGAVTMPTISARGSVAAQSVNSIGRGWSEFEAIVQSPVESP